MHIYIYIFTIISIYLHIGTNDVSSQTFPVLQQWRKLTMDAIPCNLALLCSWWSIRAWGMELAETVGKAVWNMLISITSDSSNWRRCNMVQPCVSWQVSLRSINPQKAGYAHTYTYLIFMHLPPLQHVPWLPCSLLVPRGCWKGIVMRRPTWASKEKWGWPQTPQWQPLKNQRKRGSQFFRFTDMDCKHLMLSTWDILGSNPWRSLIRSKNNQISTSKCFTWWSKTRGVHEQLDLITRGPEKTLETGGTPPPGESQPRPWTTIPRRPDAKAWCLWHRNGTAGHGPIWPRPVHEKSLCQHWYHLLSPQGPRVWGRSSTMNCVVIICYYSYSLLLFNYILTYINYCYYISTMIMVVLMHEACNCSVMTADRQFVTTNSHSRTFPSRS